MISAEGGSLPVRQAGAYGGDDKCFYPSFVISHRCSVRRSCGKIESGGSKDVA